MGVDGRCCSVLCLFSGSSSRVWFFVEFSFSCCEVFPSADQMFKPPSHVYITCTCPEHSLDWGYSINNYIYLNINPEFQLAPTYSFPDLPIESTWSDGNYQVYRFNESPNPADIVGMNCNQVIEYFLTNKIYTIIKPTYTITNTTHKNYNNTFYHSCYVREPYQNNDCNAIYGGTAMCS